MSSKIYIVGERFSSFMHNNDGVYEVGGFIDDMEFGRVDENLTYVLGQGISDYEYKKLVVLKERNSNIQLELGPKRESQCYVHKQKAQNVMLTKPEKIDDSLFKAFLALDDECAEMSDHVTGQHIQGMVIIEAARQMMLSVTERYLLEADKQLVSWFILNNIEIEYFNFLFPFEVQIHFDVTKLKKSSSKAVYRAKISFYQRDQVAAVIIIKYSVYNKGSIARKESEKVRSML